jgi:hypothetical protein
MVDEAFAEVFVMSEWISVKDRLPEKQKWVLFHTIWNEIEKGALCDWENELCSDFHYKSYCQCSCNSVELENITHWREIPEPP